MSDYPYATHLNVYYGPREVVDVQALADACTDRWYNQTLCRVNDSVVRLGVVQGEYHWHKHDTEDEFFYVVEGRFRSEEHTSELQSQSNLVCRLLLEKKKISTAPRFDHAAPRHLSLPANQ